MNPVRFLAYTESEGLSPSDLPGFRPWRDDAPKRRPSLSPNAGRAGLPKGPAPVPSVPSVGRKAPSRGFTPSLGAQTFAALEPAPVFASDASGTSVPAPSRVESGYSAPHASGSDLRR